MFNKRVYTLQTGRGKLAATIVAALLATAGCSAPSQNPIIPTASNAATPLGAATSSTGQEPSPNGEQTIPDEASLPLMDRFLEASRQADSAADLLDFIQQHIEEASTEEADAMLRGLSAYYETDHPRIKQLYEDQNIEQTLIEQEWTWTDADDAASIKDDTARAFVLQMIAGGYKFGRALPPIVIDYNVQRQWDEHLSDEMNRYVSIQELATDKPYASDGGLLIDWNELAERILSAEQFLKAYRGSPEYANVRSLYDKYLFTYVAGNSSVLPNTPFNDGSFKLLDEVRDSYSKLIEDAPQSTSAAIVAQWLTIVAANNNQVMEASSGGYALSPDVQQFYKDLPEETTLLLAVH